MRKDYYKRVQNRIYIKLEVTLQTIRFKSLIITNKQLGYRVYFLSLPKKTLLVNDKTDF